MKLITANSIIFFDLAGRLASSINFVKMYDNSNTLIQETLLSMNQYFRVSRGNCLLLKAGQSIPNKQILHFFRQWANLQAH